MQELIILIEIAWVFKNKLQCIAPNAKKKKNALIVNILIHNNSEYLCQLIEDCSED